MIIAREARGLRVAVVAVLFDPDNPPPCRTDPELFYSPVEDGRVEVAREEREALAGMLCASCPKRLDCLEQSLVAGEYYGVWGGLSEGDRRKFLTHLREEGYSRREIPSGLELQAALNSWYRYMPTPEEKYHGENELVAS